MQSRLKFANFGKNSRIFTKAKFHADVKSLRKKGSQLQAGIDPTILPDIIKVGIYHLESGAREFSAWSQRMLHDLGDGIRPHLQELYQQTKDALNTPIADPIKSLISSSQTKPTKPIQFGAEPLNVPQGRPPEKIIQEPKEGIKVMTVNWKSFLGGVIIGLAIGFLLFSTIGNRYEIQPTTRGFTYKLDKWTGRTWMQRYYISEADQKTYIWYWEELKEQ